MAGIHITDIELAPNATPEYRAYAKARGFRSSLAVPLLSDGDAIGVVHVQPGGYKIADRVRGGAVLIEQSVAPASPVSTRSMPQSSTLTMVHTTMRASPGRTSAGRSTIAE